MSTSNASARASDGKAALREPGERQVVDCLILGAGPAGLTAALYLRRFRRSVLVADAGQSRATLIPRSHNFPGFPGGVRGPELLARLRAQLTTVGPVAWGGRVLRLAPGEESLWHTVFKNGAARSRSILFATGVTDRRPPIPNAEMAIKTGLLRFCPICDGFEAMRDRIAVIGMDDHAAREAIFLRAYSPNISLLTLGANHNISPDACRSLEAADVRLIAVHPDSLEVAGNLLLARRTDGAALPPFQTVYGALGVDPQSILAKGIGVVVDGGGCIVVDAHQRTALPCVYAAGDVVRGLHQISVAIGEAAIAATAIHNMLPPVRDAC